MWDYELDLTDLEQVLETGTCECGNELISSTKGKNFRD